MPSKSFDRGPLNETLIHFCSFSSINATLKSPVAFGDSLHEPIDGLLSLLRALPTLNSKSLFGAKNLKLCPCCGAFCHAKGSNKGICRLENQ